MKIKTLALALLTFAVASVANAVPVTVNSVEYDITTITTTFDNDSTLLMSQPWWNNDDLALQLSVAIGYDLGTPHSTPTYGFGPIFVYSDLFYPEFLAPAFPTTLGFYSDETLTFAIVASVPESAPTLILTAGGLLVALFVWGRSKRA